MFTILKDSTHQRLLRTIEELERQLQGAKANAKQFEDGVRITMQQKNEELTKTMAKLMEARKQVDALTKERDEFKENYENSRNANVSLDEAIKAAMDKLDRNKRYQKEQSQKYGNEIKELKDQLENANKRIEEDDKDLKELRAKVSMMSILYKAGVEELTKFMRSTPAYKKLKKDVVRETADTWICERAKKEIENLPQAPKPEETKEEVKEEAENKEESKDKE